MQCFEKEHSFISPVEQDRSATNLTGDIERGTQVRLRCIQFVSVSENR